MKQLFILMTVLSWFIFVTQVFGQSIQLSVPEDPIDINETFFLEISVQGNLGPGQVTIDGLEPFEIKNQSTRTLMQSVNGENTMISQLVLELYSNDRGTYTVGPAQIIIDGNIYESEQYQLVITGQKLFVNGAPQGWGGTQTDNQSQGSERGAGSIFAQLLTIFFRIIGLLIGIGLVYWLYRHFIEKKKLENNQKIDSQDSTFQGDSGEQDQKPYSRYNADLFQYDNTMVRQEMQEQVQQVAEKIQTVKDQIQSVVIGQDILVRNLIIALLARGHILLEGVPGLAKTLSIETLAKTLGVKFNRIQFTPDLLPSDLVGSTLFNPKTAKFHVNKGPVFTNLLLADEINRAPAKVQSALLEAMEERQVTIGDETSSLDEPFVVMATQNPLEQEGTYSLPEAQLDRFLLKTTIDYPSEDEEMSILEIMSRKEKPQVEEVWSYDDITNIWNVIDQIYVSENIYTYVKDLIFATRNPSQFGCEKIAQYIAYGVSPRGSLALIAAGKVIACMEGRDYLLPEDIQKIAYDVMRHRIVLSFDAVAQDITTDIIIQEILHTVPVVDES